MSRRAAIASLVALSLVTAACSSGHNTSVSNTTTGVNDATVGRKGPVDHSTQPTLTVAVHSAVISLDLSKETYQWSTVRPLMHTFITHEAPDGSIVPSDFTLATSFGYVGDGNKIFEIKLRKDALFSDGTPVTAQSVKAWFEYFAKGTGVSVSTVPKLDSIDVLDDLPFVSICRLRVPMWRSTCPRRTSGAVFRKWTSPSSFRPRLGAPGRTGWTRPSRSPTRNTRSFPMSTSGTSLRSSGRTSSSRF